MSKLPPLPWLWPLAAAAALLTAGCAPKDVDDEAKARGKTPADFPETQADVFHDMDMGISLAPGEIAGRNTWMLWSGGNEAFWDYMARYGYGLIDFLKVIDSRQRSQRFAKLGLMNEPGYRQAAGPDQYGLYVDQPVSSEPDGTNPEVDGKSSGIIGLRLFANPNFDEAARKKWDAVRFYNDPVYYQDPKLVRPYRVGMTCALCHVSFHPLSPPQDPEAPLWSNLSSTIGNQYLRTRGLFGPELRPDNFMYHALDTVQPGTIETSIIATDNNNNPNIINSIYNVGARLGAAVEERVSGASIDFPPGGELRRVPHILVDGADSIGVAGALDRVYVNIGLFGEEWIRCHNPIIGIRPQKPFSIPYARAHSVYWQVTEQRTANLTSYLAKVSQPMPLRDAPGGAKYLTADQNLLNRGKIAFAEHCMACHSSKRPNDGIERRPEDFAKWAHTQKFLSWARAEVMKPDFLDNNYLSTDARYPVTLLQTNAARALQDNATRGKIWEEFSSEAYKNSPSVGNIQVYDPYRRINYPFRAPGGGPGYYRVPTLIGIWAGAPFLHNNSVGDYNGDPSVDGRMRAFDDAMDKFMWPAKRQGIASIARTSERCYLIVSAVYLPVAVVGVVGGIARPFLFLPFLLPALVFGLGVLVLRYRRDRDGAFNRFAWLAAGVSMLLLGIILLPVNLFLAGYLGDLRVGPIPKGTPVNLLASMNPKAPVADTLSAIWKMNVAFYRIKSGHLGDAEASRVFDAEAGPALLKVSKCPDLVQDRGHYFAAPLSDVDKAALKEFLKTF